VAHLYLWLSSGKKWPSWPKLFEESWQKIKHDAIMDFQINSFSFVSASFPSVLEPIDTCLEDGKRPDGMTMIPWSKGEALLWDAICVDTYAALHLNLSSVSAGTAASEAEVKKQNKYRSLSNDYNFVAVGWSENFRSVW